jgi:NADPH:quinone reductase-like Zn-dependent oxidoreductase
MRVLRLSAAGGPEQLAVEDADRPRPGPEEALVRVHAAAITRGELEWPVDRLPAIPSYELSGVVEEVGPGVSSVAAGDEVFALTPFDRDGVAAEYTALPAELLVARPRALGHAESAAIPVPALAAWQGLFDHGRLRADERVLIHGAAGGVGGFAVQLARASGAHVIGTASAANLGSVRKLGAHQVIDAATRFEDAVEPVDVVFDTAGGARIAPVPHGAARWRATGIGGGGAARWRRVLHRRAESRPAQVAREAGRCRRAAAPVRRGLSAHVGARGVRAQPGAGRAGQGCISRRVTFRSDRQGCPDAGHAHERPSPDDAGLSRPRRSAVRRAAIPVLDDRGSFWWVSRSRPRGRSARARRPARTGRQVSGRAGSRTRA